MLPLVIAIVAIIFLAFGLLLILKGFKNSSLQNLGTNNTNTRINSTVIEDNPGSNFSNNNDFDDAFLNNQESRNNNRVGIQTNNQRMEAPTFDRKLHFNKSQ